MTKWHEEAKQLKREGASLSAIAAKFKCTRVYACRITRDVPSAHNTAKRQYTGEAAGYAMGKLHRVTVAFTAEQIATINQIAVHENASFSATVSKLIDLKLETKPVGFVDRLSAPTRVSAIETAELEMPVFAAAPHLETASPDTILSLLDENAAANAEIERLKDALGDPEGVIAHADAITARSDAAEADLAALKLETKPAAFEVLDHVNGTYVTTNEQAALATEFPYNGLYRRVGVKV